MKGKNFGLLAALMTLAVLMVSGVSAFSGALSMNATSGSILVGESLVTFNITIGAVTNLSLYASAADTNATSAFVVNSSVADCVLNTTQTECNFTIDTTTMEDSSEWVVYAIGKNASSPTDTVTSASSTIVTTDNTAPQIPSSLTATVGSSKTVTITGTVTARNTTHGWIEFKGTNPGTTIYTDDLESGGQLSFVLANVPASIYEWRMIASDGADNTTSSYQKLTVDYTNSAGKIVYYQEQQQGGGGDGSGTKNLITAIIVIIVIIVIFKFIKKR